MGEPVRYYAPYSGQTSTSAEYVIHKGRNTAWIQEEGRVLLASSCQLAPVLQDGAVNESENQGEGNPM